MKITRVYAEPFWKAVLAGAVLFVPVFFGLFALSVFRALRGESLVIPILFFAVLFLLGAAKSALRLQSVHRQLGSEQVQNPFVALAAHILLWPLASVLYLYNSVAALLSRRIEWRGIVYELKSPRETVIIQSLEQP
jgi:hypothetical protein